MGLALKKIQQELQSLKEQKSFRKLLPYENRDGRYIFYQNKKYLNLSSNDYLGLASNKTIIKEFYNNFHENIEQYALGSSSSRLLTGNDMQYEKLEKRLAQWYGKEKKALVFNSGYHANLGIISAIVGKGDLIISDKLNHASIIDAIRLSGADYSRYNHLDYSHLEKILKNKRDRYSRVLIISESVFSMDGDIGDIGQLIRLKQKYEALLYIDEAHAAGVYGKNAQGISYMNEDFPKDIDVIMGTFGKAFGSIGAYAITSSLIKEYLINKSRTLIFTTGLPPVVLSWNLFILNKIGQLKQERDHLIKLTLQFREKCLSKGLNIKGNSQIVPIIIGNNQTTVEVADKLKAEGFWVMPVRPPTVPHNSSRLRISLTSNIQFDSLQYLPEMIAGCFK